MKKVLAVESAPRSHWVGDGFPVRSLFSYDSHGGRMSPFLLLDYAGPERFDAAVKPRGVGEHPHRGFETVTVVYEGEVDHRDSTGAGGHIGPGDVQWMTAAGGIIHEEFHSEEFTRRGGLLEMVQLWVNLPARHKMSRPRYQTLRKEDIPTLALPDGAGSLRVIAGDYQGARGPAQTFTPLNVWDIQLKGGAIASFVVADGQTLALVVLRGTVQVNGTHVARDAQLVQLDRAGTDVQVEANTDASFLLLGGEPIDEPIVGYGPFVMNSREEIAQAITDFNSGRFGQLTATG